MVLEMVDLGVDIFDSSYAFHMAEEGRALTFPNCCQFASDDEGAAAPTLRLADGAYKEDFGPISSQCSCFTCDSNHSRAYINHLLATRELLGPVLLTIHNLHWMDVFFRSIRECVATDSLAQLKDQIDKCASA
jgi:queuine tRNA-ribosyltransferase subunit QTRTD1